jgi:hypothetical protein
MTQESEKLGRLQGAQTERDEYKLAAAAEAELANHAQSEASVLRGGLEAEIERLRDQAQHSTEMGRKAEAAGNELMAESLLNLAAFNGTACNRLQTLLSESRTNDKELSRHPNGPRDLPGGNRPGVVDDDELLGDEPTPTPPTSRTFLPLLEARRLIEAEADGRHGLSVTPDFYFGLNTARSIIDGLLLKDPEDH